MAVAEAEPSIVKKIMNPIDNLLSGVPRFLRNAVEGREVSEMDLVYVVRE